MKSAESSMSNTRMDSGTGTGAGMGGHSYSQSLESVAPKLSSYFNVVLQRYHHIMKYCTSESEAFKLISEHFNSLGNDAGIRFLHEMNRRIFEQICSPEEPNVTSSILMITSKLGVANLARYLSYLDKCQPLRSKRALELSIEVKFELLQQVSMDILRECIADDLDLAKPVSHELLAVRLMQARFYVVQFFQFLQEKQLIKDAIGFINHADLRIRLESAILIRTYLDYMQSRNLTVNSALWSAVLEGFSKEASHGNILLLQELLRAKHRTLEQYNQAVEYLLKLVKTAKDLLLKQSALDAISDAAFSDPDVFASLYFDDWLQGVSKQFSGNWNEATMVIENIGQTCSSLGRRAARKIEVLIEIFDDALYNSQASAREQDVILKALMQFSYACKEALQAHITRIMQRMYESFELSASLLDCFVQLCHNSGSRFCPLQRQFLIKAKQLLGGEEASVIIGLELLAKFKYPLPVLSSEIAPMIMKHLQGSNGTINFYAAKAVLSLSANVYKGILVEIDLSAFIAPLCCVILKVMGEEGERRRKIALALLAACREDAALIYYDQDPFISLLLGINETDSEVLAKFNRINLAPKFRRLVLKLTNALSQKEAALENAASGEEEQYRQVRVLSKLLFKFPDSYWIPYCKQTLEMISARLLEAPSEGCLHLMSLVERIIKCNARMATPDVFEKLLTILQENRDNSVKAAVLSALDVFLSYGRRDALQTILLVKAIKIVTEMYKMELDADVRKQMMVVMGLIGAVDPNRIRSLDLIEVEKLDSRPLLDEPNLSAGVKSDFYFPSYVLDCLKRILMDPSLADYHTQAFQAVVYTLKTLGNNAARMLDSPMQVMLQVIKGNNLALATKELYLQEMASVIGVTGVHMRKYLPEFMAFWEACWESEPVPYIPALLFLEAVTEVMHAEMAPYGHSVAGKLMLYVRKQLGGSLNYAVQLALSVFKNMASLLEPFLDDLSKVLRVIGGREDAPKSLLRIARQLQSELDAYFSVEPCCDKVIIESEPDDVSSFESIEMDTAPALMTNLSTSFTLKTNIENLREAWRYRGRDRTDWSEWLRQLCLEFIRESPTPSIRTCSSLSSAYVPLQRKLFNVAFASTWLQLDVLERNDFLKNLELVLSSSDIPQELIQVFLDLVEFMDHEECALNIDRAMLGTFASKVHAFAKALYYREGDFRAMPSAALVESLIGINNQLQQIDAANGVLRYAASKYGIALKETWFEKLQRWDEALASYKLILTDAQEKIDGQEELGVNWDIALGAMRCYHALGEWSELEKLLVRYWPRHSLDDKREQAEEQVPRQAMALIACASYWASGRVGKLGEFVGYLPEDMADGTYFRALLAFSHKDYETCRWYIDRTRRILEPELGALLQESYSRAYNVMIRTQMLSELEEAIEMKNYSQRRSLISSNWISRIAVCQENIEVRQRILRVRNMAVDPEQDLKSWLHLSSLALKNNRQALSEQILRSLLNNDVSLSEVSFEAYQGVRKTEIKLSIAKHLWMVGERERAYEGLGKLSRVLARTLEGMATKDGLDEHRLGEDERADERLGIERMTARCWRKWSEWKLLAYNQQRKEAGESDAASSSSEGSWWGTEVVDSKSVLDTALAATSFDKNWYRAWHSWAMANLEFSHEHEKKQSANHQASSSGVAKANPFVTTAIQGFFKAIALSAGNNLQDSLRLLTLWFRNSAFPEVNAAIGDGMAILPVDNWLQVLPQLIARIQIANPQTRRILHTILGEIGKRHPQSLVYPLTVASKSQNASRRAAALNLLDKLRSHSALLVDQAVLISQELVRLSVLWEEMWYDGLEEASRHYFGVRDLNAMFAILDPLHQVVEEQPAESKRERDFVTAYGADLREARELCMRHRRLGNETDLAAAWDIYYQVFRRLSKAISLMTNIELAGASPKLSALRDLELAVPGTFRSNATLVSIRMVEPVLQIISSKQRPRKVVFIGNDGRRYRFLLKGHEDLRQDERVMQLFELMNRVLASNLETQRRQLGIKTFAVIPLSQSTGLIEWVAHCDTFHSLIREYREGRHGQHGGGPISLSQEHKSMLALAPDYEHLTTLQKTEIFGEALRENDERGRDFARIFWLKSRDAETWFERRVCYMRSLAVMSMAGYVLGLGDRHPSNLLLDRVTGQIVHIDFGDCFEVAMRRERYPERVPFRLTRMLQEAMEAGGLEGTFRLTCEATMRVLRASKDSLMAVLEAFIYDPLINWRLLTTINNNNQNTNNTTGAISNSSTLMRASRSNNNLMDQKSSGGMEEGGVNRWSRVELARLEEESLARPETSTSSGAINALNRVAAKLNGRDFGRAGEQVSEQVSLLIREATRTENLCQAYIGWCAFW